MGRRLKLLLCIYLVFSTMFFAWLILELSPSLKYSLTNDEKEYIVNKGQSLIFEGDIGYAPFSFNDGGSNSGYEADLIYNLDKELGFEINYIQMPWHQALAALERGEIDVITGMRLTPQRKLRFSFTEAYLNTIQAIITKKEIEDIDINDLSRMRVIVQAGSITHQIASEKGAQSIITVDQPDKAIELLEDGIGDVWIENNMTALYYLRLRNKDRFFNIEPLEETKGQYGMAVSKNNTMLMNILNKQLYKMEYSGTLAFLDKKWFGMEVGRSIVKEKIWTGIYILSYIMITILFAILLWTSTLKYKLNDKTKELQDANKTIDEERNNIKGLLDDITKILSTVIDYRDAYTGFHSRRVAYVSRKIAEKMELDDSKIFQVYVGALVHDVGKIGIPDSILKKEGQLTDSEYDKIKEHPQIGYEILSIINSYRIIKDIAHYHHERWDGNVQGNFPSYPGLIKGDDIPLAARIVAVADAFDAMISDRPYRRALPLQEVKRRIIEGAGSQFDPCVVRMFIEMIDNLDLEEINTFIGSTA